MNVINLTCRQFGRLPHRTQCIARTQPDDVVSRTSSESVLVDSDLKPIPQTLATLPYAKIKPSRKETAACVLGCPWSGSPSAFPSLDEEPEDYWDVQLFDTEIILVRIHMLARNRCYRPDAQAMPPGVTLVMLEARRQTTAVFTNLDMGRRVVNDRWTEDTFRFPNSWTGSTMFWAPLRGRVSLADLGLEGFPGLPRRDRSRSRGRGGGGGGGSAGPGQSSAAAAAQPAAGQQRPVRPRLRALQ